MNQIILTLLLLPLLGACLNGFFARRWPEPWSGVIATTATTGSFVLGIYLLVQILSLSPSERIIVATYFNWMSVGPLVVDFALRIDPLSLCMILVVTGVGSLIHLYSIGYMAGDKGFARYFCYLNLFIFMMLLLVMAANLPLLFVGWEGVGLCSYLLIGFWYEDIEKAQAGKKAFIVNRIGDACFLIGMFFMLSTFGTLDFLRLETNLAGLGPGSIPLGTITIIALLFFAGATGKSAQIPLYVWLPDAMAGPTPVSALIHAATMVTAGVYMIARLNAFYLLSPVAMNVVAIVGIVTAIFAALIAISQNDIKKVLAYSTISQLGYMFCAVGVGAFASGIFHLITHSFFKALLFLGAGSVIHAMGGEQDIHKMGGLKRVLPITSTTFLIAVLAISGIPIFAGFFSKDAILWFSVGSSQGGLPLFVIGAVTAFLTAIYMFRVYALTFLGAPRFQGLHPHEAPPTMALPLVILGVLSLVGGFIGLPEWTHLPNLLDKFVHTVLRHPEVVYGHTTEIGITLLSVGIAVGALFFAYNIFVTRPEIRTKIIHSLGPLPSWSSHKFYIDEFYAKTVVLPVKKTGEICWKVIDVQIIDRIVNFSGKIWKGFSTFMSTLQTGNAQGYALLIAIGTLILMFLFMKG